MFGGLWYRVPGFRANTLISIIAVIMSSTVAETVSVRATAVIRIVEIITKIVILTTVFL